MLPPGFTEPPLINLGHDDFAKQLQPGKKRKLLSGRWISPALRGYYQWLLLGVTFFVLQYGN